MPDPIFIEEAKVSDAPAIAGIHLDARRQAMPWLRNAHTDDAIREYFGRVVADRPGTWWVTRLEGDVVAFLCLDGEHLDHLYVAPHWQGLGLGSALLTQAKSLRPRLLLWTFQQNSRARAFYEARGFASIKQTDGDNEENEPDVQYEWRAA